MPRSVNPDEYAARRNEILATAQKLVYTKGYDLMTIQDILDSLQISKGAFYHYFDSKQALLEALIEYIQEQAETVLSPIVADPELPAIEKMQSFFNTAVQWKTSQKSFILALLRVWYADENSIVRQKVQAQMIAKTGQLINAIARQGVREKVFDTQFPNQTGEIMFTMMIGLGDTFARALLHTPRSEDLPAVTEALAAYSTAIERILGAPPGSLELMDADSIHEWFEVVEEDTASIVSKNLAAINTGIIMQKG